MHLLLSDNRYARVLTQSCLRRPASVVWVMLLVLFPNLGQTAQARGRADDGVDSARDSKWIQRIVDDFRAQLGVPQQVDVTIVEKNPLVVSVEPTDDHATAFVLSIEASFLAGLNEQEVRGVVAHELGHVWIFTHHPYLQTEGLANEIAKRLVGRDNLVQVYEKLWQRQGTTGDLARLVGD
jgi:hypothetical protein